MSTQLKDATHDRNYFRQLYDEDLIALASTELELVLAERLQESLNDFNKYQPE